MAKFTVQTINESPKILILGQESTFGKNVIELLTQSGFEVVVDNVLNQNNHISNSYYKIIWIDQSNNLSDQNFNQILSWLEVRSEPKIVITNIITECEGDHPALAAWKDLAKQKKDRVMRLKQNQDILLLVGLDLLTGWRDQPITQGICSNLEKGELIDPQVVIHPQTNGSFLATISNYILSPWQPDQIVISGNELNSEQLVLTIARKLENLTQEKIEIKVIGTEVENKQPLLTKIVNNPNPGVEEWLVELIKQLSLVKIDHETKKNLLGNKLQQPQIGQISNQIEKKPIIKTPTPQDFTNEPPLIKPIEIQKNEEKIDAAVFNLFTQKRVEGKEDQIKQIVTKKSKFIKKTHKRSLAFWISLVFSGTGLGIVFLASIYLINIVILQQQTLGLMGESDQKKDRQISLAKTLSNSLKAQTETYRFLPAEWFVFPDTLWEISHNFLLFHENQNKVDDLTTQSLNGFLGQDNTDVFLSSQAAAKQAGESYKQLSLLQAALKNFDDSQLSNQDKQKIQNLSNSLDKERKKLINLQQVQSLLPSVLAAQGRKIYAVLIQDSQELRATGGFINTVAIITIDHGVLVDKQVFSSYELDQKIEGKVQPPNEIIQYLNEKQFYLRDANWDPDFFSSATTISWFIEKSLNKKVDGVIALDSYAIKDILKALGPIDLPQYNEVITDKNFLERTEFHSEVLLSEGTTKSQYLSVLSAALLENISRISTDKAPDFLNTITDTVENKHLIMAFFDSGIQSSFRAMGWTGEITTPSCPAELQSDRCIVDAIAQIETNIGVNKANFSLTRSIEQTVNVGEKGLTNNRKIILKNDSVSNAWPKGDYKALFRIYLDPAATNEVLTINNQKMPLSLKLEHGKKVVSFIVTAPIQQETTIDLTYFIPQDLSLGNFGLVFFDQKQPGTNEDDEKVTIKYDTGFNPTIIAPQADVNSSQIVFNMSKKAHIFVGAIFAKN